MGWLYNALFGTPKESMSSVPKKVQEWEEKGWKNEQGIEIAPRDDMIPGETPVEPAQGAEDSEEVPTTEQDPYRDSTGSKIRPEVVLEHVKSDLSDDMSRVDVWAKVRNESEFEIEVTKIDFLGYHAGGCFLKPAEVKELKVFSGNTPKNEAYHSAYVQYKIIGSGDYFQTDHYIQHQYEQTENGNFYVPKAAKITLPVRDI